MVDLRSSPPRKSLCIGGAIRRFFCRTLNRGVVMRAVMRAFAVFAIGWGWCAGAFVQAAETQATPQEASKATDPGLLFDRLDTSHAGSPSADKILADKRGLFERLLRLAGKSADGQLTRAEFVAQLKSITEPPSERRARNEQLGRWRFDKQSAGRFSDCQIGGSSGAADGKNGLIRRKCSID